MTEWLWFPPPTDSQPPENSNGKLNGPTDGGYCMREGTGKSVAVERVCMWFKVCLCMCIYVYTCFCVWTSVFCVCAWGWKGGERNGLTQDVWNLLAWQNCLVIWVSWNVLSCSFNEPQAKRPNEACSICHNSPSAWPSLACTTPTPLDGGSPWWLA